MAWWTSPRVLRRLTLAATSATAWYCVFHVEYHTDRPHVFTWIQGYYRKEVIEPVGRAKTALLAKLAEKKDEP